jgi:hypothetical protein
LIGSTGATEVQLQVQQEQDHPNRDRPQTSR